MGNLKILLIHGVGHQEADPSWMGNWKKTIGDAITTLTPSTKLQFDAFLYDEMFKKAKVDPAIVAEAMARLMASGVVHGISDIFSRRRGLVDDLRWAAGMVAQWAADEKLRKETRAGLLKQIKDFKPDIVCAHSLGSLIAYDLFARDAAVMKDRYFVTLGSQIGNPFVRSVFGGRIVPLASARCWFHLYNEEDDVFTASLKLDADNFEEVTTFFNLPGPLDHDAPAYLGHANTRDQVWQAIVKPQPETLSRSVSILKEVVRKPKRRALLVGINEYPNPALRLEGCVNDVYLMSEALQEQGFEPEEMRIVLNDRASAKGVLERLEWLLEGSGKDDVRFFYYSGHGAQIPGYGASQEADHIDECLVTHDFDWSLDHAVTDDQFYKLYSQLPYDTRFVSIFDCCHSGGMTRDGSMRVRGVDPPDDIRHRSLKWDPEKKMWLPRKLGLAKEKIADTAEKAETLLGRAGAAKRLGRAVSLRTAAGEFEDARKAYKHHGPYMPVLLEACKEDQYAHEYRHGSHAYGAFTFSLVSIFRQMKEKKETLSYEALVKATSNRIRQDLKFHQTPVLVCPKDKRTMPLQL